jgi:hypothetical protein
MYSDLEISSAKPFSATVLFGQAVTSIFLRGYSVYNLSAAAVSRLSNRSFSLRTCLLISSSCPLSSSTCYL